MSPSISTKTFVSCLVLGFGICAASSERLRLRRQTSNAEVNAYYDSIPLGLASWGTTHDYSDLDSRLTSSVYNDLDSTLSGGDYGDVDAKPAPTPRQIQPRTDESVVENDPANAQNLVEMPQNSRLTELQGSLSSYHVDQLISMNPPRFQYISYARQPGSDDSCSRFERRDERLPSDRGYWPGIDGTGGAYLYGTVWGQEAIWQHQHPADCSKANVVLMRSFPSGIGSVVDITAHVLSVAFRAGHVVMWHPDDVTSWWGPWCGDTKTLDCYFEPITNCTVENSGLDVSSAIVLQMENGSTIEGQLQSERQEHPLEGMDEMLQCSPIAEDVKRHWWKNQATAFLARPNQQVLEELAMRQASMFHFDPPGAPANAYHTVSIHIRWSEAKRNEADLVPLEQMWQAAEALQHVDPRLLRLFVSTESAEAIQQAQRLQGWEATFVEVKRTGSDSYEQTKDGEIKPDEEMLNSLLNLQLSLQSDAFICNRYSNWCGFIDSLRVTAARKADRPLLDNGGACKFCNGDYSSMLCGLCPKCPW